jgi:hypothetical protein
MVINNKNPVVFSFFAQELGKRHILRGLIKEMISANPEQRPKLDEVLTRPIFNTTASDELLKDDTCAFLPPVVNLLSL